MGEKGVAVDAVGPPIHYDGDHNKMIGRITCLFGNS
jgi:hypothetical protein